MSSTESTVEVVTLQAILEAFNRHDLDGVMRFFGDECTLELPRGRDPWGQRACPVAANAVGDAARWRDRGDS